MKLIVKWIFLISSIGLFIISLYQDAFYEGDNIVTSLDALFGGWMIIFIKDPAYVSWFANPILFISWMNYVLSGKRALEYSIAATGFAISFLFFREIITNEGGISMEITSYGIGYFLWLLSCIIMVVGCIINRIKFNESELKR